MADGTGGGVTDAGERSAARLLVGGNAAAFLGMPPLLVGADLWATDWRHAAVLLASGALSTVAGLWMVRGAVAAPPPGGRPVVPGGGSGGAAGPPQG